MLEGGEYGFLVFPGSGKVEFAVESGLGDAGPVQNWRCAVPNDELRAMWCDGLAILSVQSISAT